MHGRGGPGGPGGAGGGGGGARSVRTLRAHGRKVSGGRPALRAMADMVKVMQGIVEAMVARPGAQALIMDNFTVRPSPHPACSGARGAANAGAQIGIVSTAFAQSAMTQKGVYIFERVDIGKRCVVRPTLAPEPRQESRSPSSRRSTSSSPRLRTPLWSQRSSAILITVNTISVRRLVPPYVSHTPHKTSPRPPRWTSWTRWRRRTSTNWLRPSRR